MRISNVNTNPRAGVVHNHARNMRSSKTQKLNNYTSAHHVKAPQLKQFSNGSAKAFNRKKEVEERTKMI